MVAHALRARQHGSVVGHGDDLLPMHGANAGHHAIGRRVLDQVFRRAAAALRGHGQSAVFHKRALVTQIGDVLAGGAQSGGMALGHGFGTLRVLREGQAVFQFFQISPLGGVRSRGRVLGRRRLHQAQTDHSFKQRCQCPQHIQTSQK